MYSGACKVSINTIKKLNFWYGAYISYIYRNISLVDFVLIYFKYRNRIILLRKFNLITKKINYSIIIELEKHEIFIWNFRKLQTRFLRFWLSL